MAGSARPIRPELLDILSLLLPNPHETGLLRASLWRREAGRSAWQRFEAACDGNPLAFFRADTLGVRKLGPLLLQALEEYQARAAPALLTALRTARLREELRTAEYLRICDGACATLASAGIPFLLLGGAALGRAVYLDPVLRHAHDIDLLVRPAELDLATEALARGGFAGPTGERRSGDGRPRELCHPSGLPLMLHSRLFAGSLHPDPAERLWSRARAVTWENQTIRVLSPADALVQILGKAAGSLGRRSLVWAADSWLLMHRMTPEWEVVIDGAERGALALPAFVMLRYLREALDAPVPDQVLERLKEACGRLSPLHRDVTLYHAREGRSIPSTFAALRHRSWRAAFYWARFLLLPSAEYLRWTGAVGHPGLLPVRYLTRPASWLWQAAAARLRAAGTSR